MSQSQHSAPESFAPPDPLLLAFNSAAVGVAILSLSGRFLRVNPALCSFLGVSAEKLIGSPFSCWISNGSEGDWQAAAAALRDGATSQCLEVVLVGNKKRSPYALLSMSTIHGDAHGRIACHILDITWRKQEEESLREIKQRFIDIAAATYDQIWETDGKHRFTHVFDARNIPSFPLPDSQTGKRHWELPGFEPFEVDGLDAHKRDLDRRIPFRDFQYFVVDATGQKHYWRSSGQPVYTKDGIFQGYRGVSTNISFRRRAEAALQRSESRFRSVVDHSPTQIYIRDTEGRYVLWNSVAEKLFNVTANEAIGHTSEEILPSAIANALGAHDDEVLATGSTIKVERNLSLNGRKYTFLTVKFPIRDDDGTVCGIGAISTDITERKAAEERVRESEVKYRQLYELANDPIFTFDDSGHITDINERGKQLLDLSRKEVMGRHYSEVFQAMRAGERGDGVPLKATIKSGLHEEGEVVIQHGRRVPIEMSWSVSEINGKCVIQGIFRDISERKQTEMALQASQESLRRQAAEMARIQRVATVSEMASAFAHQINQPINAVANYTGVCLRLLTGEASGHGQIHHALSLAHQQALSAGKLVRDLGDFIQRTEPRAGKYDINEIVRSMAALAEPEFQRNHIRADLRLARRPLVLCIEKIEIEQAILNLLVNAQEAIVASHSERRIVTIRTVAGKDHIDISVQDTGPGIAEEFADQIFEPFASTKQGGVGLGLALSRSIVDRHMGRIWAENLPQGGAKFCIALPLRNGLG